MDNILQFGASLLDLLPSVATFLLTILGIALVGRMLDRRDHLTEGQRLRKQVTVSCLGLFGAVASVIALPITPELRGQLLSFIGLILTAAVALSSTTLLGNALAGVMLRATRGFRMGDYIRVGDHFGRVSERGLFHTEIQTEDRDLTTLPNLFLVTLPVTTIRSSGTIISTTVTLGYDVPRQRVEELLLRAAESIGLKEPFIQVMDLGDFSVSYRVAGLLKIVGPLLTTRSRLRAATMDALHAGGVEIVSPTFMNQRNYQSADRFIPMPATRGARTGSTSTQEKTAFDKADDAQAISDLQISHTQSERALDNLRGELKGTKDVEERARLKTEVDQAKDDLAELNAKISEEAEKRAG